VYALLRTKNDGSTVMRNKGKLRFVVQGIIFAVSLALLFVGGSLISDNAQELSLALGLPLFLIGIIVAVGTCLPEMAFAIRSCNKKHCELGLGNILGNVLADSMLTIGLIALIQPIRPSQPIFPLSTGIFMVVSAVIVYAISRDGVLDRKDGALLVTVYGAFLAVQYAIEGLGI